MELEWGDVPSWVSTGIALGGVGYGAWNLRIIRRDNRSQLVVQLEEKAALERGRREQQARLVWWIEPKFEYTERDGVEYMEVEVHNDSDRPIIFPMLRTEIRESVVTSTIVDVLMPHSTVKLESVVPPRPMEWTKERRDKWQRVQHTRRLYFMDASNRTWEAFGKSDAQYGDADGLRDMTNESRRVALLRGQSSELKETHPDGGFPTLRSYDAIEVEIRKHLANPIYEREGDAAPSSERIDQDVALTKAVIQALAAEQSAALINKVLMVIEHVRGERPDRAI